MPNKSCWLYSQNKTICLSYLRLRIWLIPQLKAKVTAYLKEIQAALPKITRTLQNNQNKQTPEKQPTAPVPVTKKAY